MPTQQNITNSDTIVELVERLNAERPGWVVGDDAAQVASISSTLDDIERTLENIAVVARNIDERATGRCEAVAASAGVAGDDTEHVMIGTLGQDHPGVNVGTRLYALAARLYEY